MDHQEQLAWLALVWGAHIGPAGFDRLLGIYGSAQTALLADPSDLVAGEAHLNAEQAARLPLLASELPAIERQWQELQERGVRVLFAAQADYPPIFRQLPHPSPVLCVWGKLLPIDDLAIGIVGTRRPTHEGYLMSRDLAQAIASEEFTIVSGLARGIDTAAHEGALFQGGRTLALPGSGISDIFPPENQGLAARIARHGAVISELPPQATATVPNLMARNRLISLLSRAVIVVESGETGGSFSTAQAALAQRRRLLAVAWPQEREQNLGNRLLHEQGAEAITNRSDIPDLCQQLRGPRPISPIPEAHASHLRQLPLF